jgi:hypothetical protein
MRALGFEPKKEEIKKIDEVLEENQIVENYQKFVEEEI